MFKLGERVRVHPSCFWTEFQRNNNEGYVDCITDGGMVVVYFPEWATVKVGHSGYNHAILTEDNYGHWIVHENKLKSLFPTKSIEEFL